ncbi:hypothetical protein [Sediminibacterium sp.]|uniref:hypothetical protein n=1 Tax=Sediminibacterium sp. TaxID=1917865 RepID=UPI0025F1D135|nr:hypothetical protein [Sediminibacterium sp.]MBW0179166.1 hypothetical protein [Sediminibacterium sp.]
MRSFLLLLVCLAGFTIGHAADSLMVDINKTSFKKGDTIDFSCIIPNFEQQKLNAASLHVWIDNITTGTRWKFRYPFINGEAQASIVVGKEIPNGHYAVNFLVQKGYFRMTGEIKNHLESEKQINYMMIPKNKRTYFETISLNPDGQFRLKSTLFEDSAYFVFTPVKKTTKNTLHIGIETPLDSSFIPIMESRVWVTVGNTSARINKNDSSGYVFNMETTAGTDLLPGVTVVGKYKKKIEQYDEYYSSGLFQKPEALVFDGIEDETMSRSMSILRFLEGKVPGLIVEKDQETMTELARWRGEPVEIYLDEFRVSTQDIWVVSPSDVAMVKVYRPPAMLSPLSGSAGAIAIYTKRGEFSTKNRFRHSFTVKGYTSALSTWQ